jgi:hypothetical protein
MAPAEAPPRSPVKTVVGFLRAGEPIEEHHGQGGRRGARASPTASGGGDPRGDERAVRQDQVPARGPPRGMVWSLQKRAWCPPGELGGRRGHRRRRHGRDAGGAAARRADETVPRDGPVALRTSREKWVLLRGVSGRHRRPREDGPGERRPGQTPVDGRSGSRPGHPAVAAGSPH